VRLCAYAVQEDGKQLMMAKGVYRLNMPCTAVLELHNTCSSVSTYPYLFQY